MSVSSRFGEKGAIHNGETQVHHGLIARLGLTCVWSVVLILFFEWGNAFSTFIKSPTPLSRHTDSHKHDSRHTTQDTRHMTHYSPTAPTFT